MSGLFSFSDSASNRQNKQDKVSPEILGASNSEQREENVEQEPVAESSQELGPQLASESQPQQEPTPTNLAGVDFEAPELEAHVETTGAAKVEPEPEPNIELIESSAESTTPMEIAESIPEPIEAVAPKPEKQIDRRKRRRALISAAVRVRDVDVTYGGLNEILTTTNASRIGILFQTSSRAYKRGMELAITFPYSPSAISVQAEQMGRVARITETPDGRFAIAVAFGGGVGDFVDACGRKLEAEAGRTEPQLSSELKKPLILALDADPAVREMVKTYLSDEGYEVIAVSSNGEAREVLNMFTPALVIAEIEGEDMPGYDLCAHIKSTENLKRIPVMLMTGSAYPSDYSSAHSLGAVVCIAKPFRQERFGHVVRLLAPLPHEKEQAAPARRADPTRRHVKGNAASAANGCSSANSSGSYKNGQSDAPPPGPRFQMRKWK
jgi:CheY-like chemotaxis protein